MEIRKTLIEELINCNWLNNCGDRNSINYDFETVFESNSTKIVKSINAIKWENICLEESGNLTAFLCIHHKMEYNKNWNVLVGKAKSEVISQIIDKIEQGLRINNLPDSVIEDIKFNAVSILVSDAYSDYYVSEFYCRLLKIYTSGHLPCGWEGNYPSGKIIVF